MSAVKLYYFDFRGRAEITRMVLTLAGKQFEDIRFSREDWAAKYKADAPFGQVPYIEFQGKKYAQSKALAAYFAAENGLYGKNNLERLQIDQVIFLVDDLLQVLVKGFRESDAAKKAELDKKTQEEELPKFFGFLESLLKENAPNSVYVGKEITLADLYVQDIMLTVLKVHNYDAGQKFPALQALRDTVESNPRLKPYMAARKDTPY